MKEASLGKPNAKTAEFTTITGSGLSRKPSALKFLLQSVWPEDSMEQLSKRNTDVLIGELFRAKVVVEGDGEDKKNGFTSIEMVSIEDPFEDVAEDDGEDEGEAE
jgi:hypothetical protein